MLVSTATALCHAWFAALLATAPAATPDECLRGCDAIESQTDQQTCRLQCDAAQSGRDRSGVTTWRRTERSGGAPPGSAHELEGGTTTTVETTDADGTRRTTTTTTNKRGTTVADGQPTASTSPSVATKRDAPRPTNAQAAGPYIVLASCQTRCDADGTAPRRATCKLACLDASPGVVKRRRAPRSTTPSGMPRSAREAAR